MHLKISYCVRSRSYRRREMNSAWVAVLLATFKASNTTTKRAPALIIERVELLLLLVVMLMVL